jgi:hypothetical protein
MSKHASGSAPIARVALRVGAAVLALGLVVAATAALAAWLDDDPTVASPAAEGDPSSAASDSSQGPGTVGGGSPEGPRACTTLRVVTAASFAPVLDGLGPVLQEDPTVCVALDVSEIDGRPAVSTLAASGAHVWIPDDASWVAGADPSVVALPEDEEPAVLAMSPILALAAPGTADRLAADGLTWTELADAVTVGEPVRLVAEDPAGSGDGLVAIGALGEVVWLASGMDAASGAWSAARAVTRTALDPATTTPAEGEVVLVPEHALLGAGAPPAGGVVLAPSDHTAVLRYTWVPTTVDEDDEAVRAARQTLLDALTGQDAQEMRPTAGLRGPDMAALPGADWLPAASAPALDVMGGHHVEHVFAAFYEADRLADLLVVVDVSGSMFAVPPGGDRPLISEVKAGVLAVADQLPDDAQLGIWEFGTLLDPPRDHRVVQPATPLSPEARQALAARVQEMNAVETGTGLYDTLLAAYLAARDVRRPDVRSQVIVFTDGNNDADETGLTPEQLTEQLAASTDPAREVGLAVVVYDTDGSGEARAEALGTVLEPIGGYVSTVRSAQDVTNAFAHIAAGGLHG